MTQLNLKLRGENRQLKKDKMEYERLKKLTGKSLSDAQMEV